MSDDQAGRAEAGRHTAAGGGPHRDRRHTLWISVGLVVVVIGAVAGFKLADLPPSDGVTVHIVPDPPQDLDEYWTPERIRDAKPL
ncbi:hypothetical protein [Streptomyces sp. 8N616]|uniref:hypothetical protein n=1 Tax=Streptomyces sp. 8N616 TaxID=3457414 RepID=UPI003FD5255E